MKTFLLMLILPLVGLSQSSTMNGSLTIGGNYSGNGSGLTNLTSSVQRGSTNVTALTAFTATFSQAMADTNYTAISVGNGIALAGNFVSSKTTTNCVFNMTLATGTIDWMIVK